MRRIAAYSKDIKARLSALRVLTRILGDSVSPGPPLTEAKWEVVTVAPVIFGRFGASYKWPH